MDYAIIGTCWVHEKRIMWIEPNWDIYLCPRLPITIGNIYRDDIVDVFENKYDERYEKMFSLSKECEQCSLVKECIGGDLCEKYSYYGDIDGKTWILCAL